MKVNNIIYYIVYTVYSIYSNEEKLQRTRYAHNAPIGTYILYYIKWAGTVR